MQRALLLPVPHRHGLIGSPEQSTHAALAGRSSDGENARTHLLHESVGLLYRLHVTHRSISPSKQRGPSQRPFHRNKDVKAVYFDPFSLEGTEPTTPHSAVCPLLIAAGGPCDGNPLPTTETVPVPDQFEGRIVPITSRPEPGEISDG